MIKSVLILFSTVIIKALESKLTKRQDDIIGLEDLEFDDYDQSFGKDYLQKINYNVWKPKQSNLEKKNETNTRNIKQWPQMHLKRSVIKSQNQNKHINNSPVNEYIEPKSPDNTAKHKRHAFNSYRTVTEFIKQVRTPTKQKNTGERIWAPDFNDAYYKSNIKKLLDSIVLEVEKVTKAEIITSRVETTTRPEMDYRDDHTKMSDSTESISDQSALSLTSPNASEIEKIMTKATTSASTSVTSSQITKEDRSPKVESTERNIGAEQNIRTSLTTSMVVSAKSTKGYNPFKKHPTTYMPYTSSPTLPPSGTRRKHRRTTLKDYDCYREFTIESTLNHQTVQTETQCSHTTYKNVLDCMREISTLQTKELSTITKFKCVTENNIDNSASRRCEINHGFINCPNCGNKIKYDLSVMRPMNIRQKDDRRPTIEANSSIPATDTSTPVATTPTIFMIRIKPE